MELVKQSSSTEVCRVEERWNFMHEIYLQFQVFYSTLDHFSILLSKSMDTMIDVFNYLKSCQMEE